MKYESKKFERTEQVKSLWLDVDNRSAKINTPSKDVNNQITPDLTQDPIQGSLDQVTSPQALSIDSIEAKCQTLPEPIPLKPR